MSTDPITDEIAPRILELELRQFASRQHISNAVLHMSKLEILEDVTRDFIIPTMVTYVASDHVVNDVVTVEHRRDEWASWWQHTKAAHFPTLSRWMRRPPRTAEVVDEIRVSTDGWFTFPDADIYPVRLGHPVRLAEAKPLSMRDFIR